MCTICFLIMHTISPIVTWPSWSDLALYTEYIIFWAALPSPCSNYISWIILKPFLQSFGLCFSNFGSLVIVQITHFLFTSPLWQLFILWHVFSPSHFGSSILWDVFSPSDCDSCLLWHAFYSWMGFGFFMRLLFTFLLRHSSFCGMYLILVTAFCGMCSVHESACAFLCGLHTAFTFLLWQLFIMWHMFSSSVCDNSLCDMFSYCDSSSNGMCSADLIATNHRPEKLSTSCWSVGEGQQRVGQVQLRQWLWQISEILTSNICYTKLQDCSCNLRTAHCNHHTIFGEVHGSQMPYNKSYIHKERDTHMYTNLRRIKTNVINAYTYANDKLNCSWINFIATKHGKFSRKPQAGSVRKTLAGICRSLLFDVLSTLFRRIFILWM